VSRFNPTGTQLTYSTYLGAQSDDLVRDLVVSPLGPVTLVGTEGPIETFDGLGNRTDHGTPFPTTPDAVARTHLGASDVVFARLTLDGAGAADLRYSTIFGGFYIDDASSVAQDPNDRIRSRSAARAVPGTSRRRRHVESRAAVPSRR
jgi:hypothetical protein